MDKVIYVVMGLIALVLIAGVAYTALKKKGSSSQPLPAPRQPEVIGTPVQGPTAVTPIGVVPQPPIATDPVAPPAAPLSDFMRRMLASGDARGANAGGPGNPNATAEPQPEFRDGNVHRFNGPDTWELVADRKCGVLFQGGESGGVPGPVTITVKVNGSDVFSEEGAATLYEAPRGEDPNTREHNVFAVEKGDRISISITGRPDLGMHARLGVRDAR